MTNASPKTDLSLRDQIISLICEELQKVNHEKIELSEKTDMTSDMNVDSLAVMDLMFALEEEFDVSVPLNDLADIRTIGELADLVTKLKSEN